MTNAEEDADYRSRLDVACEDLGMVLVDLGDDTTAISDDDLVRRGATKLKMLFDMLVAAGVSEGILKVAIRS